MENLPWPEKFRPTDSKHLVGNVRAIATLREWILEWKTGIPQKHAVLLVGPPGVGKTSSVGVLARELDIELVEFNASDKRNRENIEKIVWRATTQQTLDGRPRIILLDEIDGMSGRGDRGGIGALLKVIGQTVHPIVMTANDPDNPRLKDLYKMCKVIQFAPLRHEDIMTVLNRVLSEMSVSVDSDILETIVERAGGDLRAALSDLEAVVEGDAEVSIPERDTTRTVSQSLGRLFMAMDSGTARQILSNTDVDHDELLLWLEENTHCHRITPEELNSVFDALSLADLVLGRVRQQQNWKLLSYFYDIISTGIVKSRLKTPYRKTQYNRPSWPLLVWRGNRTVEKRAKTLERLSELTGVSRNRIVQTYWDLIIRLEEQTSTTKSKLPN